MLGLSAVAFSGASASAAAMLPLLPLRQVTPKVPVAASSRPIIKNGIRKKNNNWNGNWNNNHNWKYRKHRRGYDNGAYLSLARSSSAALTRPITTMTTVIPTIMTPITMARRLEQPACPLLPEQIPVLQPAEQYLGGL